ncbi:MAG: UbiD family decarboxylase, partial [Gammaproteobacteria bacterium]|nr:UbiD family decarboxylase [Gammaproteobacteria bacterium]
MESDYDGLRSFIRSCDAIGECITIDGADWNLEIGALTEAASEFLDEPPMILFDKIRDYPAGFRVLSLPFGSAKRFALALGLPPDKSKLELVRLAANKIKNAKALPPTVVDHGPILQNVMT